MAWHPTRNEILTSSWDFNLNINTYQSVRRPLHKRYNKDMDNDADDVGNGPPPRRSRRIALRQENNGQASGSSEGVAPSIASTSQQ